MEQLTECEITKLWNIKRRFEETGSVKGGISDGYEGEFIL